MSAPGLIVGNLDCEVEQAATGPALPANVLEMLSASATLLRVLARDGDTLWTPRPVDPSRVVPADGIPMPRLASGPLDEMPRFERVLAWGETVSVARRRLDGDAHHLMRINRLIEHAPAEARGRLRPVDLKIWRPSTDLGELANDYEARLPWALRFLARGTGTKESRSNDFLSMIMFQGDYLSRLVECGEQDAEAQRDEILAFLGS